MKSLRKRKTIEQDGRVKELLILEVLLDIRTLVDNLLKELKKRK